MTTQSITSDRTNGQEKQYNRFFDDARDRALAEANPGKDGIQRLIARGGEFQDWVIDGIRRFSAKQPDYIVAQQILGVDFITPEEVAKARPGVVYTDAQIALLAETIPSAENLRWCKDNGYAVMPAPPSDLSLLEVRDVKKADFYSKTGGWYAETKEKFSRTDKTSFGWLAIRKTPVPNSTSKNWDEQNQLLSAVEHVPNAAMMPWFITTYFAVRGVRLFPNVYVRTSSLDSGGGRVSVVHFGEYGLRVRHYWVGYRIDVLGLASARKF